MQKNIQMELLSCLPFCALKHAYVLNIVDSSVDIFIVLLIYWIHFLNIRPSKEVEKICFCHDKINVYICPLKNSSGTKSHRISYLVTPHRKYSKQRSLTTSINYSRRKLRRINGSTAEWPNLHKLLRQSDWKSPKQARLVA